MQEILESKTKRAFVEALAEGNGIINSGIIAGADPSHLHRDHLPVALSPAVRTYVRKSLRGRIDVEASPEAYRLLRKLMLAELTPIAIRVEIGKYFISHSIAAPKAKDESDDNDKEPSDMSTAELREYLAKLNAESAKRGELIDATPAQAIDDVI